MSMLNRIKEKNVCIQRRKTNKANKEHREIISIEIFKNKTLAEYLSCDN
jgi:hypothetical protein